MPRWEHGSAERMQAAALDLFAEQGFEKTTVVDIAARAGVTRRTFARHFPDKREVLFSGSVADLPETALVEGISRADAGPTALQMIVSAIAGYDWDGLAPRALHRRRHDVIAANPELRERELLKFDAIALALTDALRQRGFDAGAARLAADVGIAVFRSAYDRWLGAAPEVTMGRIVHDVVAVLRTDVVAAAGDRSGAVRNAG
jgi:AcrR family transcriptional regulator